ncbi:MAG: hypothetical protein ACXWEY_10105 [Bacteroidia bacterium]
MNFSIFTDYPWYFLVFCLAAGAAYAFFAYRKNTMSQSEKKWFAWPVWLLAVLRFLSVSLLAFLLLSPVIRSIFKKVEKPVVIIAADNSQSVLLNKDSAYYKNELPKAIEDLKNKLAEKYDVRYFKFGNEISDNPKLDFTDKQTDLSGLYDNLYQTFYNQNIGAVITLSDGIYNRGQNPLFVAEKFNAPFYTVALGDTMPRNDVLIKDVQYNRIVYTGNFFPLQIGLRAKGYAGKNSTVTVTHKGKTVFGQPVNFGNNNFYTEVTAKVEATTPGLQLYHIEISRQQGEVSYVNNSFDVFIDVLDSRKKILMVSYAPHPDIAAIKGSIERNAFYEVTSSSYNDLAKNALATPEKLKNYQLAILHQLPSTDQNASTLINSLKEAGVPIWFILGNKTSIPVFNTLETGIQISAAGSRTNESGGYINNGFGYFTLSENLGKNMQDWPPLITPFGEYKVADRSNVFLWQQIGRVQSQMPLLAFSTSTAKTKSAVLVGEGIWKWFMFDFAQHQSHTFADEVVNKTVQYLSVKSDSRPFRVRPAKNMFFEDERVSFEAEVYNQSFEPVKNALISMKIRNEAGKNFEYSFQPRGNGYAVDAGFLPSGQYSFTAQTKIGEKPYSISGEFIVKKVELEYLETEANHSLLRSLAVQQGGKMIYPKDLAGLPELLEARDDIQPVAYMQTDFKDLIHFKWLFFIVFAMLAAEWFLRKYFGSY